jgi:hypothetical protein
VGVELQPQQAYVAEISEKVPDIRKAVDSLPPRSRAT